MTEGMVRALIEDEVVKAGSAMALARRWKISVQYLSDIRRMRRGLTSRVLEPLGLVAFIDYRAMTRTKRAKEGT